MFGNSVHTKQRSATSSCTCCKHALPLFLLKMRLTLLSFLLCLFTSINALHFYLDANQKRCFIEELTSDTVVEGMQGPPFADLPPNYTTQTTIAR